MGLLDKADLATLPPGMHSDGDGLNLQVKGTSRSWIYRYTFSGKPRALGLGAFPQVSLKDARVKRNDAYKIKHDGRDPKAERDAARATVEAVAATTKVPTFREWFEVWYAIEKTTWKSETSVHATQVRSTIETHAFPVIGSVAMTKVTRTMVVDALTPIWHKTPETARRIRQRIEAVFAHFLANHEDIEMANPADRTMITKALLKQKGKKGHHASLHYDDMAVFMADLRSRTSISASALEFTILTATRTTEALDARWAEISFGKKTWTIPGERMKNGEEHVVPLSDRVVEILRELHAGRDEGTDYVFPGMRYGEPLSNMALLSLIGLMGYGRKATTHGMRATFRTWASNETNHAHEVKEKALAHTIGDETERAYNRGDLLGKRRALMDDWAAFCVSSPPPAAELPDNVVTLKTGAAA